MSESESEKTRGPSPAEWNRIFAARQRFEAAWRRGEHPRIEDELTEAGPGPGSDALLSQLLPLEISLRIADGESPVPEDYSDRFPASRGLIDAAFADRTTIADALGPRLGASPSAELLAGILALQNGFVDHVALIAAIREWGVDRSRGVGALLLATGRLDERQWHLLEALAAEHRRRFGDDLRRIISSFGALAPVLRAVEGMGVPEIEAGLTTPPESTIRDEEATTAGEGDETAATRDPRSAESSVGSASRFRVIGFHDQGMLGKVFLARDLELNRDVALKEIQERHAHHPLSRAQFVLEGMITGALEHPGIVPVYSLGTLADGNPFYAMRFIKGPSLRDKLGQLHGDVNAPPPSPGEPPPTLHRLLRHFVSACHAIAYANGRGVLHRDLKPEHVLLGPFGETLIVDWGLAMPIPGAVDETGAPLDFPFEGNPAFVRDGVVVGTLPYMSPEQALGMPGALDRRSDVYALGAILFALLTGRAPFRETNVARMLAKVRAGEVPRPRSIAAAAPAALEAICLKAMSHDRHERYDSATELARDVERWLDDEPTVAYPEPIAVRAGRWARRHRAAAMAAVVGLVCATAGLVALNLQARTANAEIARQRDLAETARAEAVAARLRVEENFRTSIHLVENYLLRVSAADLPAIPGSTRLRRDVASLATGFLEHLWKQKPDDPEVCRLAARSYRELANIRRLIGRTQSAAYSRAIGLLRLAGGLRPDEPKYRDLLAETLQDLASSLHLENRPADAEPHLREALKIVEGLRDAHPDGVDYLRTEARASNGLSNQLLLIGRFDEAAERAARAVAIMTPLADSKAPGPTDSLEAVMYHDTLGEAEFERGRHAEAAASLDEALRRVEADLAASPRPSQDLRMLRGSARMKRSRAIAALGRGDEAARDIDAAILEFDELVQSSNGLVPYRELLAEALLTRAEASAGEPARADLARAEAIAATLRKENEGVPAHSGLLGRIRGRAALLDGTGPDSRVRLSEALSLLRDALKVNADHPASLRARKEFEAALKPAPPSAP